MGFRGSQVQILSSRLVESYQAVDYEAPRAERFAALFVIVQSRSRRSTQYSALAPSIRTRSIVSGRSTGNVCNASPSRLPSGSTRPTLVRFLRVRATFGGSKSVVIRHLRSDAPQARDARASADRTVKNITLEAVPQRPARDACADRRPDHTDAHRRGKRSSEIPRTAAEIDAYADAVADMFCAYLGFLEHG